MLTAPVVFRLLWLQLAFCVVTSFLSAFWFGMVVGYSTLLGGLLAWLPSSYFAWRVLGIQEVRTAQKILRIFYVGEMEKFAVTAVLFALTFLMIKSVLAPVLFISFIVVQSSWYVLLFTKASS